MKHIIKQTWPFNYNKCIFDIAGNNAMGANAALAAAASHHHIGHHGHGHHLATAAGSHHAQVNMFGGVGHVANHHGNQVR